MAAREIKRVHFIGIGGVGMSGIARVAKARGMQVSGSDLRSSRYTDQLKEAGITIFIGQVPENLPGDDDAVIVVSTAILDNNPELMAARARNLTIWHRAQMLAYLGVGKKTLAVAGTHGKTTTSSMLASTLDGMGFDPSYLIGGVVRSYGTNAHAGSGDYYVVEADESDKSFVYLDPTAVIVTNIEADHLDHYADLDEIYRLFGEFMGQVPTEDGILVVCGDQPKLIELAQASGRTVYSYGFDESCDARVLSWEPRGIGSVFTLRLPDGTQVEGSVKQNPGKHNVSNAAGVLTLLWALGLPVDEAAPVLGTFAGVSRRFDLVGEADGVTVVDDYAHHPTEIAATIGAAARLDFNHVYVIFQPHRYSRVKLFTEVLRDEFGSAFDESAGVLFMDVYPAGEMPVPGISGQTFLDVVLAHPGHPKAAYVPHRMDVVPTILPYLEPGDLVFTLGAGDVTAIGPQLVEALERRAAERDAASGETAR